LRQNSERNVPDIDGEEEDNAPAEDGAMMMEAGRVVLLDHPNMVQIVLGHLDIGLVGGDPADCNRSGHLLVVVAWSPAEDNNFPGAAHWVVVVGMRSDAPLLPSSFSIP
jgi:hypothetical protein